MFYFLWFALTIASCLLAAMVGLWVDRKLDEKE